MSLAGRLVVPSFQQEASNHNGLGDLSYPRGESIDTFKSKIKFDLSAKPTRSESHSARQTGQTGQTRLWEQIKGVPPGVPSTTWQSIEVGITGTENFLSPIGANWGVKK